MDEYGPFLITYYPENGSYLLTDMDYVVNVGLVKIEEGPGAVIQLTTNFLDASQAGFITEFLSDLNSTLNN